MAFDVTKKFGCLTILGKLVNTFGELLKFPERICLSSLKLLKTHLFLGLINVFFKHRNSKNDFVNSKNDFVNSKSDFVNSKSDFVNSTGS